MKTNKSLINLLYSYSITLSFYRVSSFSFYNKANKKLTKNNYSNLSKINRQYYLEFRILIKRRQFFEKKSQNREYVKTFPLIYIIFYILDFLNG